LLDSEVQERQREVDRLESLLQSELAVSRREKSKVEALERQGTELTAKLTQKVDEHQRWHQRELELEQGILQQKDQLANSVAAAANQEVELNRLRSTTDDLLVIQSALCTRVRELTTKHDAAAKRIHELDGQSQAATRTIQARDQELAALRHAILDAARIGTHISRERFQVECGVVDGWKRLITSLLETPLSMAQRGLVGEIIGALDGWRKGRPDATSGVEFQVEPPDLHRSEFNCTEVLECALAAVRKNADETGAKVQTALVGPVPECADGSPQHLHQLIIMLFSMSVLNFVSGDATPAAPQNQVQSSLVLIEIRNQEVREFWRDYVGAKAYTLFPLAITIFTQVRTSTSTRLDMSMAINSGWLSSHGSRLNPGAI